MKYDNQLNRTPETNTVGMQTSMAKISRIYHGIVTTFDREADSFLPSLNQAANKTQLIVSNGQNLQLDELNFYGLVLFITQFNRTTHRPIK